MMMNDTPSVIQNSITILFIAITLILFILPKKTFFDRPIWYDPKQIWTFNVGDKGDDSSQQLFDLYSLTHISHGIIFYSIFRYTLKLKPNKALIWAMIAEIAWELVENTDYIINKYRKTVVSRHYPGDSWINSVGDVWVTYIGAKIAMTTTPLLQAIIVIGLELFLYNIHGDNLLTNVLTAMTS
jgi:hypothetical protein